jgi:hypothetical protein
MTSGAHRRTGHILDDVRQAGRVERVAGGGQQPAGAVLAGTAGQGAVVLAWRRGVDGVEPPGVRGHVLQRVALNELVAGVPGLWPVVDAGDVEPGELIATGCATGAREQVEHAGLHRTPPTAARPGLNWMGLPTWPRAGV